MVRRGTKPSCVLVVADWRLQLSSGSYAQAASGRFHYDWDVARQTAHAFGGGDCPGVGAAFVPAYAFAQNCNI